MQHTAAATAFLLIYKNIIHGTFETNIYYVLNTLQIVLFFLSTTHFINF